MAKQTAAQQANSLKEEEYDPEKHGYVKNKRRPGYSLPSDPVNTSGENDPTETTQAGGPTPGRGPEASTDMEFGNAGGDVKGRATITDSQRDEIKKRALARYGHS